MLRLVQRLAQAAAAERIQKYRRARAARKEIEDKLLGMDLVEPARQPPAARPVSPQKDRRQPKAIPTPVCAQGAARGAAHAARVGLCVR